MIKRLRDKNPTSSWCDVDLIVKTDGGVFFEFSTRSEIDLGKKGSTYPRYWSNRFSPPNDKILKKEKKIYFLSTFPSFIKGHRKIKSWGKELLRKCLQKEGRRESNGQLGCTNFQNWHHLANAIKTKRKKDIKSYICMQLSFGMSSLKWESFLET